MRKLEIVAIVVLLLWNIFLTLNQVDIQKKSDKKASDKETIVYEISSEFETDFTRVIEVERNKVVAIAFESGAYSSTYGSGVVYGKTEEGGLYILTCAHLLNNVSSVSVYFANRESIEAEILGRDNITDLAVLYVQPSFFVSPFEIADSAKSKEGEWVLSIGNNLSVNSYGEFSEGILASNSRYIRRDVDANSIYDYDCPQFEITAEIDNATIGGAVINLNGELVGMITSTTSKGCVLLPSSEIIYVAQAIIEQREIHRNSIGAFGRDLKDIPLYLRSYYGIDLTIDRGVMITETMENSSFKVGDVIVRMNEKEIDYAAYRNWIYSEENTEPVFEVRRGQETLTIQVISND